MVLGGSVYAGECTSGKCALRQRTVNVVREIISKPVTITKKTVATTRDIGRRTINRVRSRVR